MSNYSAKDIKTLDGIEAIRLRPEIIFLNNIALKKYNLIYTYEKM